jgi:hypothetical protein
MPSESEVKGPYRKGSCVSNAFKTSLVLTTDEDVEVANDCFAQGQSAERAKKDHVLDKLKLWARERWDTHSETDSGRLFFQKIEELEKEPK